MNLPVHTITCQTPSMNLPAHGTASPDPSKASLLDKTTHQKSKEQQHFRLARPTRRQAKLFQTAWRYSPATRRQRPPRPTVFSSPPGGAHRATRRPSVQYSLTLSLSPGGFVIPPGAISKLFFTGFSTSTSLLVTYSLLWTNKNPSLWLVYPNHG